MSAARPQRPFDTAVVAARDRENVIVGNEIVRHRLVSRVIHWSVAVTFFVCVFTGMPIWTPVFGWMAHLFGGLTVCRLLHPWAGVAFFLKQLGGHPSKRGGDKALLDGRRWIELPLTRGTC